MARVCAERPRGCNFLLGVASLDIHRYHEVDEPKVLGRDSLRQATDIEQTRMTVGVGRVVVIVGNIVGFQTET